MTLVDAAGRATHRAGMFTFTAEVVDGVGVAGSRTLAHWVEPYPGQRDHGSGRAGAVTPAGHLTVYSWSVVPGRSASRASTTSRTASHGAWTRPGCGYASAAGPRGPG
ncbi:hypothetical protein ACFQX7_08575 [Luedemannella flava]